MSQHTTVLALIGNACVDPSMKQSFLNDPIATALVYFTEAELTQDDRDELTRIQNLPSQDRTDFDTHLQSLANIMKCPSGDCPRKLIPLDQQ